PAERARARREGYDAELTRPVDSVELVGAVLRVLRRHQRYTKQSPSNRARRRVRPFDAGMAADTVARLPALHASLVAARRAGRPRAHPRAPGPGLRDVRLWRSDAGQH